MLKGKHKGHGKGDQEIMKVNWLKVLPIGSHIKEALEDIKIIRSGARKTSKRPEGAIAYESDPIKQ